MGYETIDSILNEWAETNGLHLHKEYKECQVRSVEFWRDRRDGYQIWIDIPDDDGLVGLHVWDFKNGGRRRDFLVSRVDLKDHLEAALEIARKWIDQV